MSTATKTKVEFDIFKTIYVIENDKVLNDIFKTDVSKLSYNIVRNLEKQGTLPKAIGEALEEMFNVIVKNPSLLRKYNKVTEDDLDVECKVPKHYGKERILADIEANGGKSELDRAMLALNDFRNVYSKLKNRAIKDKTLGTKNLNREACRDIIATVRLVENKLGHILNKK